MRYLKIYENFQSEEEIIRICQQYGIRNFTINSDGLVDVDGDVNLQFLIVAGGGGKVTKIPLKFGHVSGYFDCQFNQLTTLEGAPQSVGGNFICHSNELTSLKGAPQSVGGFYCYKNKLTSLEGGPQSVVGDFDCSSNKLTSLEGGPQSVVGYFDCSRNKLTSLEGAPESVVGYFYCQDNPVHQVWKLISPDDKWDESNMELFNDYDCIRGTDIVIDRFNEFLRQIGRPEVDSVEGYNNI